MLKEAITLQKQKIRTKELQLQAAAELLPKQSLQALLGGVLPAMASTQLTNALFGVVGLALNFFGKNQDTTSVQASIGKIVKQLGFVGLLRVLWRVLAKK